MPIHTFNHGLLSAEARLLAQNRGSEQPQNRQPITLANVPSPQAEQFRNRVEQFRNFLERGLTYINQCIQHIQRYAEQSPRHAQECRVAMQRHLNQKRAAEMQLSQLPPADNATPGQSVVAAPDNNGHTMQAAPDTPLSPIPLTEPASLSLPTPEVSLPGSSAVPPLDLNMMPIGVSPTTQAPAIEPAAPERARDTSVENAPQGSSVIATDGVQWNKGPTGWTSPREGLGNLTYTNEFMSTKVQAIVPPGEIAAAVNAAPQNGGKVIISVGGQNFERRPLEGRPAESSYLWMPCERPGIRPTPIDQAVTDTLGHFTNKPLLALQTRLTAASNPQEFDRYAAMINAEMSWNINNLQPVMARVRQEKPNDLRYSALDDRLQGVSREYIRVSNEENTSRANEYRTRGPGLRNATNSAAGTFAAAFDAFKSNPESAPAGLAGEKARALEQAIVAEREVNRPVSGMPQSVIDAIAVRETQLRDLENTIDQFRFRKFWEGYKNATTSAQNRQPADPAALATAVRREKDFIDQNEFYLRPDAASRLDALNAMISRASSARTGDVPLIMPVDVPVVSPNPEAPPPVRIEANTTDLSPVQDLVNSARVVGNQVWIKEVAGGPTGGQWRELGSAPGSTTWTNDHPELVASSIKIDASQTANLRNTTQTVRIRLPGGLALVRQAGTNTFSRQ